MATHPKAKIDCAATHIPHHGLKNEPELSSPPSQSPPLTSESYPDDADACDLLSAAAADIARGRTVDISPLPSDKALTLFPPALANCVLDSRWLSRAPKPKETAAATR